MRIADIKMRIPCNFFTTYVLEPKQYIQDKWCNSIAFKNEDLAGQTVAVVNGKYLQPPPPGGGEGETLIIDGNAWEFYEGRVDINFDGSLAGRLSVTEKVYLVKY
jgi:hypothetical protein